jgi:hypothetical protein
MVRSHLEDAELGAVVERYVLPGRRYLKLLGFQILDENVPAGLLPDLIAAAGSITEVEIELLLDYEWRARLTASVLAGLGRRSEFRDRIGELLLASQLVFGTAADAVLLCAYLDRYLVRPDLRYDQEWAMAALRLVDARAAERFLGPGGLWERWAGGQPRLDHADERLRRMCALRG